MSATAGAQFAKCRCRNCDGHIEFDPSHAGETIECPHCKMETVLYVPPAVFKPDPKAEPKVPPAREPAPVPVKRPKSPDTTVLTFFTLVMAMIGTALVVQGCSGEIEESTRENSSAIRQTVYAIQYGFGFTIICLSGCIRAICRLLENQPIWKP